MAPSEKGAYFVRTVYERVGKFVALVSDNHRRNTPKTETEIAPKSKNYKKLQNFDKNHNAKPLACRLRPRPHVSVFVGKRNFFSLRIGLPSTCIQIFENTVFVFSCGR